MYRRLPTQIFTDLKLRNAVQHLTSPNLERRLQSPITLYFGIDPTSSAVHLGNLLPIISAYRLSLAGNSVIALIGGATARIGDPSDKKEERDPLCPKALERNELGINNGLKKLFENFEVYAQKHFNISDPSKNVTILNNKEWTDSMRLLPFLESIGRSIRISSMLGKESVQSRLKSEKGMSLTEFMYQTLQAYDFYHLNKYHNCQLQIGGSDQWGNIVAGLDLIERKASPDAVQCFGMTLPLLLSSTGVKYSKSNGTPVWLDSKKTSVFDFYQFLINRSDDEVEMFLKYFTFYPVHEIENILEEHKKCRSKRLAQHSLANDLTELVHREANLQKAQLQTELLFKKNIKILSEMSPSKILEDFRDYPRFIKVPFSESDPLTVSRLCLLSGASSSNKKTVTMIRLKSLTFNGAPVRQCFEKLKLTDFLHGQFAFITAHKLKTWIVQVVPDESIRSDINSLQQQVV